MLLTHDEWIKRKNGTGGFTSQRGRGTNDYRGGRYKSRLRCYNCHNYGHYVVDCRKPKREKDQRHEVNMAQVDDEGPALLLTESDET